MSLQDALPDRPLFDDELETLEADLPDGYQVQPGSAMDLGTGALLYPTFAIRATDGSVTLFGRNPRREVWLKLESWSGEEYDQDAFVEAVQEFGRKHFSEERFVPSFE
jgi:hypothetical protein